MNTGALRKLHSATLRLLRQAGVAVDSDEALDLFARARVRVDRVTRRVYPAEAQVLTALKTAPRAFKVYGRRTDNPLVIGGAQPYILAGGASIRVLELDGRYTPASWKHLGQFNTLLDALPHIHMLLNQVDPQEDTRNFYRRIAAAMLIGSPKPCCLQAGDDSDVAAMIRMGIAIRGSARALAARPVFITGTNAEPPLCITAPSASILLAAARAGIPCGIGDYVMMGTTAPITPAGALVQRNALQLTGLILAQQVRPGAPFYYVGASGSANLRTLDPIMANPQAAVLSRLAVQLGKFYNLPVCGLATTDAKQPDAQAATERALMLEFALAAGADLVQGPTSMMDQMMLTGFAQAVIDNDLAGYLLAARQDPVINAATLALPAICDVVKNPEYAALKFVPHPHTAQHLHDDAWQAQVFEYDTFAAWQARGGKTLVARAGDRARAILAHHRPVPLKPKIADQVRALAE